MTRKPVDMGALSSAFTTPVEEDSAPVNVLAGALGKPSGSSKKKGELEESPHLLAVREAVEGIRNGAVTAEEYEVTISKVQLQISELLELFDMGRVQRELAKTDEIGRQLAERTREGLQGVEQGLARLTSYLESLDTEDLEEGLAQVEASYLDLDRTQDDALLLVEDDDEDEEDE